MARKKPNRTELVRAVESLQPYPAVFVPTSEGGFEAIFPNLPGLKAFGVKLTAAQHAAKEALTAEMTVLILEGDEPPRPSDPDNLIAGDDEPYGTRLIMVDPDKAGVGRPLGRAKAWPFKPSDAAHE